MYQHEVSVPAEKHPYNPCKDSAQALINIQLLPFTKVSLGQLSSFLYLQSIQLETSSLCIVVFLILKKSFIISNVPGPVLGSLQYVEFGSLESPKVVIFISTSEIGTLSLSGTRCSGDRNSGLPDSCPTAHCLLSLFKKKKKSSVKWLKANRTIRTTFTVKFS